MRPPLEPAPPRASRYELRFEPLRRESDAYSVPCDAHGCVDLDALGERYRNNYLFARAVIGHTYRCPVVCPA